MHIWKETQKSMERPGSEAGHMHRGGCTDLWVSRNIWGKHLSRGSNWIVRRWGCYNSVMSLVSCAKLTISHKLLSARWEMFPSSLRTCASSVLGHADSLRGWMPYWLKGEREFRGCTVDVFTRPRSQPLLYSLPLRSTPRWSVRCSNHPLTDPNPQHYRCPHRCCRDTSPINTTYMWQQHLHKPSLSTKAIPARHFYL